MTNVRNYRSYTIDDIKEAVKTSVTFAEVLRKLNLKSAGGNFDLLKKNIAINNIDISHFSHQHYRKGQQLKEWKEYKSYKSLKPILLTERGHSCEDCKLEHWKNLPIPLELHHIDGNRCNNDKDNLKLLCCNCHAMTDNWKNRSKDDPNYQKKKYCYDRQTSKKQKNITERHCKCCNNKLTTRQKTFCSTECMFITYGQKRPPIEDILKMFDEYKSFVQVGKYFNVSDNAVRKWLIYYNININNKQFNENCKESV